MSHVLPGVFFKLRSARGTDTERLAILFRRVLEESMALPATGAGAAGVGADAEGRASAGADTDGGEDGFLPAEFDRARIAEALPALVGSAAHYFVVAEDERGEIIGAGALAENPASVEGLELSFLLVLPEFSRQGVGGELLRILLTRARDMGFPRIAARSTKTARGFFERRGFRGPTEGAGARLTKVLT